LNSGDDVCNVAVLDYDGGVVGLIAVISTDVVVNPNASGIFLRNEKEDAAVVFYEEVRRDL